MTFPGSSRRFDTWLVLVMILMAGCGAAPPDRATQAPTPAVARTASPTISAALPPPTPTPPAPPALSFRRERIPALGLIISIPNTWRQDSAAWSWAPDGAGLPRIAVRREALRAPAEIEALLLPAPSVVLSATPIALDWGSGRRVTVEVYEDARAASETSALKTVETHALILVQEQTTRYAYDLALIARSQAELRVLEPIAQELFHASRRIDSP